MRASLVSSGSLFLAGLLIAMSGVAARADDKVELPPMKVGALIQAWMNNDTTAPAGSGKLDFRIRRAELKLSSDITTDVRWFVMVDAAKRPAVGTPASGDNRILQDVAVGVKLLPELELLLGQFKTLTSAEGLEKSAELLLPERSLSGRTFGDKREPGASLVYRKDQLMVGIMASNGQATNVDDPTTGKDLSIRADFDALEWLRVGAFTLASDNNYGIQSRFGANVRVNYGGLLLSSEFITNQVRATDVRTNGFQVTGAYALTDRWQPVARFQSYKPDTSVDETGSGVAFGVNYLIAKHNAKVQAVYEVLSNLSGTIGSPGFSAAGVDGSQFTLSFQASI